MVKISRYVLEHLLKDARLIADCDKTEGLSDSADAYAHALGRCNGTAKSMIITLEICMGGK